MRKKNLNIHMLTCHGGPGLAPGTDMTEAAPLKCLACDFTYVDASKLEAHLAANPEHNVHAALSKESASCDDIMNNSEELLDDFVTSLLLCDDFI